MIIFATQFIFNRLMAKNTSIIIKGARVNNLKNIDVEIPRNKLVVITGLSGSGKSSLAFDTLYAEGQRRYVESLSSYARQFLGRMSKPECDFIKGIPPAIAIEQKVSSRNPRSTVGTSTEIYEYLRLLYARVGRTFSPVSGQEVKKHSTEDIVNCMLRQPEGTRYTVLTPILLREGRTLQQQLEIDLKQGFNRLEVNGEMVRIDEYQPKDGDTVFLLVDRMTVSARKMPSAASPTPPKPPCTRVTEPACCVSTNRTALPACTVSVPSSRRTASRLKSPTTRCSRSTPPSAHVRNAKASDVSWASTNISSSPTAPFPYTTAPWCAGAARKWANGKTW
mgnify:CR=1 FL=1